MFPFTPLKPLRQAFSLMELLLVIFIISLVYYLGFEGIEKPGKRTEAITPLNLKQQIQSDEHFRGKGTLICVDHCHTCYLREDISLPFEKIKAPIALGNLKVYTLNSQNELYKPDFGRYHDHEICLLMDFYRNDSTTPLILENEKGTYYLPAFFGEPQKVDSPEKARTLWLSHTGDLKDRGNYY